MNITFKKLSDFLETLKVITPRMAEEDIAGYLMAINDVETFIDDKKREAERLANLTPLITVEYVKDNSYLDHTTEDAPILNIILRTQVKHILPLIGKSLYTEIITQMEDDTLTAEYQELMDNYIAKTLLWWTLSECVFPLALHKNGHILNRAELLKVKDEFILNAEYYNERLTRHLKANTDIYPLYLKIISVD